MTTGIIPDKITLRIKFLKNRANNNSYKRRGGEGAHKVNNGLRKSTSVLYKTNSFHDDTTIVIYIN